MKASRAAVVEMTSTLPLSEFSKCGMAASTMRTVPSMSCSKFARQSASVRPLPPETLETMLSMPPKASAEASTQAFSASPSPTSTAWPKAVTPLADSAATASFTWSSLRAQMATLQPSSASASAMARPMPRLPPVMSALLPFSCKSMLCPPSVVRSMRSGL